MKTDLTVILDRSGSMSSCKAATISGYNELLAEQKKIVGECVVSLCHFDSTFNDADMPSYIAQPLTDAVELTDETYIPRGTTALRDALGRTIDAIGVRLASMNEAERPGKVIVVILTDGYENASKEYSAGQIKTMIEHQQTMYNWEFNFLGANQDAVTTGASYGIGASNSMSYSVTSTTSAFASVSSKLGSSRTGVIRGFTDGERASSMGK